MEVPTSERIVYTKNPFFFGRIKDKICNNIIPLYVSIYLSIFSFKLVQNERSNCIGKETTRASITYILIHKRSCFACTKVCGVERVKKEPNHSSSFFSLIFLFYLYV